MIFISRYGGRMETMMKRFFKLLPVLLICVLLITGCEGMSAQDDASINETKDEMLSEDTEVGTDKVIEIGDYTYKEGNYGTREWDRELMREINSKEHSPDKYVADADEAIEIAIAELTRLQRQGKWKTISRVGGVCYDTEDLVWMVWFTEEQPQTSGVYVVGYCCNMAISQKSGEIVKIWMGE